MKRNFTIILTVLIITVSIVGYSIYNVTHKANLLEEHNKIYEDCYQKEILGNQLISIINKAVDQNEKNAIDKKENTIYYENNGENSIQITIQFFQSKNVIYMEDIASKGSESFVKAFGTASFKCTSIEYHEKTDYVKHVYFEQTKD
ncbi:MAG: hypothetical protein HFJ28_00245 [Clostridia bacterium]|jgi:hypothetical protein|nr:hypothetical protein [Clostridia bacterium]